MLCERTVIVLTSSHLPRSRVLRRETATKSRQGRFRDASRDSECAGEAYQRRRKGSQDLHRAQVRRVGCCGRDSSSLEEDTTASARCFTPVRSFTYACADAGSDVGFHLGRDWLGAILQSGYDSHMSAIALDLAWRMVPRRVSRKNENAAAVDHQRDTGLKNLFSVARFGQEAKTYRQAYDSIELAEWPEQSAELLETIGGASIER